MIWAVGNGESRSSINLNQIKDIKVGCNAIFRDCVVEHIVCVDRRMINEALQVGANLDSLLYTRKDWFEGYKENKRIRLVPDLPYVGSERADDGWHWGSGPYCVLLATKLSKTAEVKMLGFDLYGIDKKVNNIYKDSPNYDSSSKREVDPRYWIYQIGKVFECFPNTKFTIYQDDKWTMPKSWKLANVMVDNIRNIC
jgi:hypothetical protein